MVFHFILLTLMVVGALIWKRWIVQVGRPNGIFHVDARHGQSTVSTCGIGEGRDPGEMKASVHVVTTVCHGSVYVQSSVVITVSVCQCTPEL